MRVKISFGWLTFEVEMTLDELVELIKKLHELFPSVKPKVNLD